MIHDGRGSQRPIVQDKYIGTWAGQTAAWFNSLAFTGANTLRSMFPKHEGGHDNSLFISGAANSSTQLCEDGPRAGLVTADYENCRLIFGVLRACFEGAGSDICS